MSFHEINKKFLLLQINDALFPIGAYSHSYGLETYIQKGLVNSLDDAWDFIYRRMIYSFCTNELLSARLAYEYAANDDTEKIVSLEEKLEAYRVPKEIREAGRKLGSRFVKTVDVLGIEFENDVWSKYVGLRKSKTTAHSVAYGVFCASSGIKFEDAMTNYLYAQVSSMVTNCVKSIPLSQTNGQKLLYKAQGLFKEILDKLGKLSEEDLCLSAPGFDIRCMQHEGLYSRIYMS